MPRYAYERLSAQDYSFLLAETENAPMHVSAVGIFEAQALRTPDGGIDIGRFQRAIEAILHWIPRYRQKLAWIPVENWPTWIDDRHFDLGYHIRHIALPAPAPAISCARSPAGSFPAGSIANARSGRSG